jgi:hypothetical protein
MNPKVRKLQTTNTKNDVRFFDFLYLASLMSPNSLSVMVLVIAIKTYSTTSLL